jgi:hypothetical protein
MPEMGYAPTNKYLPPRSRKQGAESATSPSELVPARSTPSNGLLGWLDRLLSQ